MELLEAVMVVTHCEDSQQLKNIPQEEKIKLAKAIEERVPSGLATIEEWNELLNVFMGARPEKDNKVAKSKLLAYLRGDEYGIEEKEEEPEEVVTETKSKWWHFKRK